MEKTSINFAQPLAENIPLTVKVTDQRGVPVPFAKVFYADAHSIMLSNSFGNNYSPWRYMGETDQNGQIIQSVPFFRAFEYKARAESGELVKSANIGFSGTGQETKAEATIVLKNTTGGKVESCWERMSIGQRVAGVVGSLAVLGFLGWLAVNNLQFKPKSK